MQRANDQATYKENENTFKIIAQPAVVIVQSKNTHQ